MTESAKLALTVRTPHEVVLETSVIALRAPTETGQVGLHPRAEPTLLAVETGIVYLRLDGGASGPTQFIGTAGGLLICDGANATLLTPLAVVGKVESEISDALEQLLSQPNTEIEARAKLEKLEGRILHELRRDVTTSERRIGN